MTTCTRGERGCCALTSVTQGEEEEEEVEVEVEVAGEGGCGGGARERMFSVPYGMCHVAIWTLTEIFFFLSVERDDEEKKESFIQISS